MVTMCAAVVVRAAAVASLCLAVNGFTSPTAVGSTAAAAASSRCCISTSLVQQQQRPPQRSRIALHAAVGSSEDDGIEEYKKQMAAFMAQAHEKRLQAMEVVKAEVQRGYEEQIADLQSKLAALPASAGDVGAAAPVPVEEPHLVGAGAGGAAIESAGSAVGAGSTTTQHPGYAARSARPGWEARWGSEEVARTSSPVSAADVVAMEARATATASDGAAAHPAYTARAKRPGWEARWGSEEVARIGGGGASGAAGAPATATATAPAASAAGSLAAGTSHPAYAARAQRPGWEARWGNEEVGRAGGNVLAAAPAPAAVAAAAVAAAADAAAAAAAAAEVEGNVHPAYAARTQRPGWEARWGNEEPARMAATVTSTSTSTSPPAAVPAAAVAAATTTPVDSHPAYAARSRRPGWEARWGSEEKDRMAGAAAGAVAAAGAAAGFATAGGLDAATPASASASASASSGMDRAEDPLADDFMPDDVGELQSMVLSNRRYFQEYLLKSLEASNEVKQSKAKIEAELSSSNAKLAAEQQLRESLQESFLEYMSRSGDAGASGKTRIAELEKETARLAAQAEELQLYTQEYMVKASSEKQKAIEAATASARAQSAERIAALQAHVLELQAGG